MRPEDAVLIQCPNGDVVPIDEVFSYADQRGIGRLGAHRVIWRNGTWSWAKVWWRGFRCVGFSVAGYFTLTDRL